MESLDQQILGLLIGDGRMSYTDIGRATGLSTSAVQQRVRKLENRGVITGYRAVVSNEALGLMITAFVRCRAVDPMTEDELPGRIADLPEVVACYSVAGDASVLLRVLVPTPAALAELLSRLRLVGCSTVTELVLAVPFEERSPLAAMPGAV
ncbi:Lrp/AsnC family transcriptional regulator [Propionicicella superfundia]|uniref:Lrp/AsnC family transcriptional regulator n=1 Tax=Propionicicella superfundia TaxID=348582 RepID=UPI000415CB61|nr:Lrp/AsnC family transcriptional regulator [Propionicicella superfundia]